MAQKIGAFFYFDLNKPTGGAGSCKDFEEITSVCFYHAPERTDEHFYDDLRFVPATANSNDLSDKINGAYRNSNQDKIPIKISSSLKGELLYYFECS